MAGTVQRLIMHVWGFISSPAYIENKQQSYNEGDDGSGSDRTQLVAKGPTGILHTFRTWDETTSYVSNSISGLGQNIYVEIYDQNDFIAAMALNDTANLMIMNEIILDNPSNSIEINVSSSKNIFSVNVDHLKINDFTVIDFIFATDSAESIYVDFYCPISSITNATIRSNNGNIQNYDAVRLTQIKNIDLFHTDSLIFNTYILFEDYNGSSSQFAFHQYWSNKTIHGRINNQRAENFLIENHFGPDGFQKTRLNNYNGTGFVENSIQIGDFIVSRYANGSDVTDRYEINIPDGKFLHNDGNRGHFGLGTLFPSVVSDSASNTIHGLFCNRGSFVNSTSGIGDNSTSLGQNCIMYDETTSSKIKVIDAGFWSMFLISSSLGFLFYQGVGTAGEIVTLSNPRINIDNNGNLLLYNIPSGTSQANAGASANEVWRDTADNTLKLGV